VISLLNIVVLNPSELPGNRCSSDPEGVSINPDRPDLVLDDIHYPNLLIEFLHKLSPDENIDKDSIYCKCSTCEATLGLEDNKYRGVELGEGVRLCNTCRTPESN
jgi:hypothetical protein